MNIQKLFTLILAAAFNAGFISSGAEAAANTSKLVVYSFQKTASATLDTSKSYMQQFLPAEPSGQLVIPETNIVRYVSNKDVNTTFEHNTVTGDLSFHRNFSRYLGNFVPKLPTTDYALKVANLFLEKNGLLPENPGELTVAHVGGLRTNAVLSTGKPGPVVDKLVTLTFSRELNGLPVIGAGSKMIINIGDAGEIISLTRRWRELDKPIGLLPSDILTETEAVDLAKRQILSEFGDKSKFEIMQTQVAYFDNNGTTIQPVFAFQTKIQLADYKLPPVEYVCVVPAMRKPIEKLNLTQIDPSALKLIMSGNTPVPAESGKTSD